ncbi:hypothetical protein BDV96DRAFT_17317 [Lophiotrema nucula]|uniref:Uncharacterized protein n=1 Tax=Lophiotrema nucula TaxID=690887 RepID=A0A6A5ZC21_9PLEO|nr:hypothetical protein BDV96DRAFT_17317 [Lophiotrema nucula]
MQPRMAIRTASRGADASHLAQFPFMKLPREVRDCIYEMVNHLEAEFVHVEYDSVRAPLSYPSLTPACDMTDVEDNDDFLVDPITPDLENWYDDLGHIDGDVVKPEPIYHQRDLDHRIGGSTHVLAYRLIVLPLALVSKEIYTEILETTDTKSPRFRDISRIIRATVHRQRIFAPPPSFFKICTNSRLTLKSKDLMATSYFLQTLPMHVRSCFLEVVIASEQVTTPEHYAAGDVAWTWTEDNECGPYLTFIRRMLPNIRAIAIEVPSLNDPIDHYRIAAPHRLCRLLKEESVDMVRFLYRRSLGATPSQTSPLLENLVGLVEGETVYDPGVPPPGHEWEYTDVPKRFIGVIEDSNYLGAETVVRITRHDDPDATRSKLAGLKVPQTWAPSP